MEVLLVRPEETLKVLCNMRTYDVVKIKAAVSQYAQQIEGFYPEDWIENRLNVALINNNDDIALFENQHGLENTVCGHYFFFSRGKEAVLAAKEFLKEIFSEDSYVQTIIGLTPIEHKGALWMNKQLGFKENGEVSTVVGPCKFVMLTKEQWKDLEQ